jgi:hypothetical protein
VLSVFGFILANLTNCPKAKKCSRHCGRKPSPTSDICTQAAKCVAHAHFFWGHFTHITSTDVPSKLPMALRPLFLPPAVCTALHLGHMHCFLIKHCLLPGRVMTSRDSPADQLSFASTSLSCKQALHDGNTLQTGMQEHSSQLCSRREAPLIVT